MLIFPLAVSGGVAAGYLRGGRLHRLGSLHLRAPGLLLAALLGQLALGLVPGGLRFVVVAGTYALAGAWLLVNLAGRSTALRAAIGILALGWGLNLAAIAANDGMPVSADALRRVGITVAGDVNAGNIGKHVVAVAGTPLSVLGDVIPVRPLRAVVSVGDVVMLLGVGLTITAGMGVARRCVDGGNTIPSDRSVLLHECQREDAG